MISTKLVILVIGPLLLCVTSTVRADSPVTVSSSRVEKEVLNVRNGQTLSGDVLLKVRIPNRAIQYGSVRLAIDHTNISVGFEANSSPSGMTATDIPLSTESFSNGWHLLTIDIPGQHSENYRVKFDNVLYNISVDGLVDPGSLGRKDNPPKAARVTATLSQPQPWSVTIGSTTIRPFAVRTYHGTGKKISVRWDGRDSKGKMTPDDSYTVRIQAGKAPPHTEIINKLSTFR